MAKKDFNKLLTKINKWDKDTAKVEKDKTKVIEKTRKSLTSLEDKLRKDSITWKGYLKHLFGLNAESRKLIDSYLKMQADAKKAKKSGDGAKATLLEKKCAEIEKKVDQTGTKFTKNYDEVYKIDAALKKTIDAVAKLPR